MSISSSEQALDEAGHPVVERSDRVGSVEDRVHHRVGHRPDLDHQRRAPRLERLEVALRSLGIAGVEDDQRRELHSGAVRCVHQAREHAQVVRGARDCFAVEAQQVAGSLDRMGDEPAHDRLDGVQLVSERGRDTEVPAAPAQRPEEVGMRVGVDLEHLAVGRHELGGEQVVSGEPVLGHQPAEAAAERVAGDPGRRDRASRDGQSVLGCRVVQLPPEHAALDGGRCAVGVDRDPFHLGEVDHHAAIRHGTTGDVVPAAPHRDLEPALACEREPCHNVSSRPGADDRGRLAIDHPVVYCAGRVVARVLRPDNRPGDLPCKAAEPLGIQSSAHTLTPLDSFVLADHEPSPAGLARVPGGVDGADGEAKRTAEPHRNTPGNL